MSVVLDASACIPWFLPDEQSSRSDKLRKVVIEHGAVTSFMWPIELLNTFAVCVRRKRLDRDRADECVDIVTRFEIIEIEPAERSALLEAYVLAADLSLSVYDATYLEAARRRNLPLATLDDRLAAAAVSVGVRTIA